MKRIVSLIAFSLLISTSTTPAGPGKFNKVLAPGDAAPPGRTSKAPTARSTRSPT